MKQKRFILRGVASLLLLAGCASQSTQEPTSSPMDYVDPLIGTGGHGHVFVGANVPFGMVQLGPTSIPQAWDWCSGYHDSDSTVIGFAHTHLSGTGIGDLNDITIMPVVGPVTYARGEESDPESGLWSYSDRTQQIVSPGYYATYLTRYGIKAEMTATSRVGMSKFTFPSSSQTAVVFDLENGGNWDKATEGMIERLGPNLIAGYRYSTGWARDQKVYFVAEFSSNIDTLRVISDQKENLERGEGKIVYARASFTNLQEAPLYVKVALSPTSIENAQKNLQSELPDWDFDATREKAEAKWAKSLEKITIKSKDKRILRTFYTALYHTMIAPSEFSDVSGDYYGADGKVHTGGTFTNYTTLSLWDTYRAAHPLMTLIHPERMSDMMETFLTIHDQQGFLPIWHLMGCETFTMVGNPGIPVVADAILKGYISEPSQVERAYNAIKTSALRETRGMELRTKYGYIPYSMTESVAYDMEYALADWAVAQVAKQLGREEDYEYFLKRSYSYHHLFDPVTQFVRGRGENGEWREPFDPFSSSHRNDDYCEGNAWQYTFLAPHDLRGLVECFGGPERFLAKLDSLFSVSSEISGEESSPDISGLIGQYAHGNEPSHHIIYFYTMLSRPSRTAELVRQVLSELYHDTPDGLSGNEDVGQMSAWYILSALGFYQVEPAGGRYFFGSPIVDSAVMQVRDGKFEIIAHNNSPENMYIQEVKLNGKPLRRAWIEFEEIAQGGLLEYTMGSDPSIVWYEEGM